MPSVKIIIATHKKYRMPDDEMYVPVQVGAYGNSVPLQDCVGFDIGHPI